MGTASNSCSVAFICMVAHHVTPHHIPWGCIPCSRKREEEREYLGALSCDRHCKLCSCSQTPGQNQSHGHTKSQGEPSSRERGAQLKLRASISNRRRRGGWLLIGGSSLWHRKAHLLEGQGKVQERRTWTVLKRRGHSSSGHQSGPGEETGLFRGESW